MPQYGNAATILPFPDLYTSNRIAESKVLSGGISTGNWGKGAGLPGSRTGGQATPENTAFLKGYNLDTVPEGLQQEADATREVLQAYSDLRSVYAGFRKKGIDLAAIDPANPMQVEAAAIYRNLASDYLFKLNQVKQGAKYEELAAKTQAGNANVTPMPLDNTEVVTAADVAIATPATISRPVEMWNAEARTPPKSQAEYDTRIADYKRIMAGIDDQVRYAMIDGRTAEQWKANMLPPTPFTTEPIDPLADKFLDGAITNWNNETNQPPKSQTEYDTRLAEYADMVDNVDRVGKIRGHNEDQVSAWKSRLRKPTPFTPEVVDPLDIKKKEAEIRRINAQTEQAYAAAAYNRGKAGEIGTARANSQSGVYYQTVGSFVNDMERKGLLATKKDMSGRDVLVGGKPVYEVPKSVPVFNKPQDAFIEMDSNDGAVLASLPTQVMAVPRKEGKSYGAIAFARTEDGKPLYYLLEPHTKTIPGATSYDPTTSKRGYILKKVSGTDVFPKGDERAGMPVGLWTLSGDIQGMGQRDDTDVLGFSELDYNPMGSGGKRARPVVEED